VVGLAYSANLIDNKRRFIAHDLVTRARELVRHRLKRDHSVGLGLLSLIEPRNERFKANGKVQIDAQPSS
jgi:hypothetical protein